MLLRESDVGGNEDGEMAEVLAKAMIIKHERDKQSSEPIGREFLTHIPNSRSLLIEQLCL